MSRCHAAALVAAMALCGSLSARAQQARYLTPPAPISDILDAPPLPTVIVSPGRDRVALLERRSTPSIAELAQPVHRLAGSRVNPKTNGLQQRTGRIVGISVRTIAGGTEQRIIVPANANIGAVSFSPDGRQLSFLNTKENAIELWTADVATGRSRQASGSDRLNATTGDPCDWLEDNQTLLCRFVPAARGAAPVEPPVPLGPNIQESAGKPAPTPTFEDLLKSGHDEALFEYYFTSQLMTVNATTGRKSRVGRPGILSAVTLSPDERFMLVSRVKRPYSRLVGINGFPEDVEIWSRQGDLVSTLADVPSSEGTPINGVGKGPRGHRWRPDQKATVVWAEALDEGDPKKTAPHRDRLLALDAPFSGSPAEIAKTEWRFAGLVFTEKGVGLLSESDRTTRRSRTWILEQSAPPRKLWDRRQQDAYGNPGSPVPKRGGVRRGASGGGNRTGGGVVLQSGDAIYLAGEGASPQGDRPFLDRLDLKTLATERLFRADENTYESVVAPLDDEAKALLTEYETLRDTPNYYVRDLRAGTRRAITAFKDPSPQFAGIEKQFITYVRKDGVKLSGTLYLPAGYTRGRRLPLIMWAYPREFTDADDASQVTGSPYRFMRAGGSSHLFLLTQGYAILDDPAMPIVGKGETANDTYVEQLVASADAAVNKVVEMGVADRERIGVGGHSYGAFMAANLLAHSDLFRAGIARSGAYNRTLTPFGFQAERRTFWEVPQVYARMSPFFHADRINEPILLIHGEMDDNSGTFPIQSERLYLALKGHGATVRYVTLPYEAHGYAARESVLHTLAEMVNWCEKYVKGAPTPATR